MSVNETAIVYWVFQILGPILVIVLSLSVVELPLPFFDPVEDLSTDPAVRLVSIYLEAVQDFPGGAFFIFVCVILPNVLAAVGFAAYHWFLGRLPVWPIVMVHGLALYLIVHEYQLHGPKAFMPLIMFAFANVMSASFCWLFLVWKLKRWSIW